MIEVICPNSLLEIQTWFAKIITSPLQENSRSNLPVYPDSLNQEIQQKIHPGPQLKSEERVGVYHQQYWWRLITIMQEIYPSLVHLFGYEDFNRLIAEPYLLDCPPNHWFLSYIGSHLPEWIKRKYQGENCDLVSALACLDLAYEHIIFTEILPKIEPNEIANCDEKILYLQSFVMLFEFDVDFFTFRAKLLKHPFPYWQTHQLPRIKKKGKKKFFVLFRKNEINLYEEISETQFAILRRFQEGAALVDLTELLSVCDNIVDWFQKIASRNWLSLRSIYD